MSTAGKTPAPSPSEKLDGRLFLAAAAVCAATRLVGLEEFPIYFFTDEAATPLWRPSSCRTACGSSGCSFPPISQQRELSLSLERYAQVIPTWLFRRFGARHLPSPLIACREQWQPG
jgi:hypothetical protein